MSLTTLDPQTALLIVDLQKGLAGYPTAHPFGTILAQAAALAAAFRAAKRPVVLINAAGTPPGRTAAGPRLRGPMPPEALEFCPELGQAPDDIIATKTSWGVFTTTELNAILHARGITQLVIAGVATSIGVESTAREAHGLGFNVTLALDAMTDLTLEAHDYSVTRIFPRLGETGLTEHVIALLRSRGT